jgi:hypothetical protein
VIFTGFVLGSVAAADASNGVLFVVCLAGAFASTIGLVWLGWRTGERPRWRWGAD